MRTKSPTAVIIHGHHLQTPDWETLVWGTPGLSEAGRIPRGLEVAVKEGADLIIWGTGASIDPATGKKESEFTLDFARARANELAAYLGISAGEIEELLGAKSVVQLETTNTKNETLEALTLCHERDIHTVFLVSSPTHIPRCLLTAIQFHDQFPELVVCGVAADTSVPYWDPKDVAVVEPAHRPDRDGSPFNLLAKRMARARKDARAPELYKDMEKLMDDFEKEG